VTSRVENRDGATSHVAILARSLGIPALAGIEARAMELPNGTPAILDGSKGTLRLHPSPEEIAQLREAQVRQEARRKEDLAHALESATTSDGHQIEVGANIGGVKDASQVAELGGDGVGLLRSEFLFMERSAAPSEDEQFAEYKAIALAIGADRSLIIRTLDVGGDKPLAYLPIPKEDNPFLGERGIRVGLDRPEVLRTQLRALLHDEDLPMADHRSALLRIIEVLTKSGRFGVKAIGHRVVHGGEYFQEAVIVTEDVIERIEELARLAPLHNPPNAQGIRIAAEIFPGKPQVAVFDTGFHQTLPPYAFHYPISLRILRTASGAPVRLPWDQPSLRHLRSCETVG
jgi:hypothetical protein